MGPEPKGRVCLAHFRMGARARGPLSADTGEGAAGWTPKSSPELPCACKKISKVKRSKKNTDIP